MLDLSAIKVEYLDVKLPDETVLHLKKPTKAMYDWLVSIGRELKNLKDEELEEKTYEYATRILNRNNTARVFSISNTKMMPVEMCDLLVMEYTKWVHGVISNPN